MTLLSAVNLAISLAIWQLIEAWLSSHSLQSVQCVGSRTKSCVFSECVDVHFERLLIVSGSPEAAISRSNFIWVRIQKKEKSTIFGCRGLFPFIFCCIERVTKLTFKESWLKLATKCHVLEL